MARIIYSSIAAIMLCFVWLVWNPTPASAGGYHNGYGDHHRHHYKKHYRKRQHRHYHHTPRYYYPPAPRVVCQTRPYWNGWCWVYTRHCQRVYGYGYW